MADLTDLRAVPDARARLDAHELALIDKARRAGATWAEIADALGLTTRQAAEQRRLRLATAAAKRADPAPDRGYGEAVLALRAAASELHRRIGADRRWDRRFTTAALVRETLAATPDAPPGSLFSLAAAAVGDLEAAFPGLASPGRRVALPRTTLAAVQRLRAALGAATPSP
nr:hypothetical protein [uncultured Actinoplanes sp.]